MTMHPTDPDGTDPDGIDPDGQGIRLRPIAAGDIEMMRSWRNRDDVRCWFRDGRVISAADQQRWYAGYRQRADDLMWIAEQAMGGSWRPLGQAALYRIDQPAGSADIGRFIAAPELRGSGRFGVVCRMVIDHAFGPLHLARLGLEVRADNIRARRLYDACGFRQVAQADGFITMVLHKPRPPCQTSETSTP